jgi:isopenicillin N synthase-like dioxygenase
VEPTLPVIDLSLLRGESSAGETARLRSALHDSGFLYLTGHGVDPGVVDGVFAAARDFFALPIEERLAIENVNSPHFRGYTRLGNEYTQGRSDQRDQLDVGPEREPLAVRPGDAPYLRMVGPNQWPASLPSLRVAVLAWFEEARRVSIELLRALAVALGQRPDWFDPWFDGDTHDHLKVVQYPGSTHRTGDQGVGAHKDYGWMALLLQDDLGGLQVQSAEGQWLDATPIPGTFVVNIGEMLEVATNGYLQGHGAPRGQPRHRPRPALHPLLPRPTARCRGAADRSCRPTWPEAARGVEDDPANPLLPVYGDNALKGWLHAHPAVAERWWSDVLSTSRVDGSAP